MEFDDDELDDGPVAPLLPPEDRLWRHPSEVRQHGGRLRSVAPPNREPRLMTVVALTTCISVLLTLGLVAAVRPVRTRLAAEPERPAQAGSRLSGLTDVAALAERVAPAITQIVARRGAEEVWGSGVIFRKDGMLLTSHRVVDGADSVRVVLHTGRDALARVVGSDAETDLAVLDLGGDGYDAVAFADRGVKVGQPAVTIGASRGEATGPVVRVTVVSAIDQEAASEGQTLTGMIQTGDAIAPGCTGAAIVDAEGAVIAIAAGNVQTEAGMLGYATPVETVKNVAQQLLEEGRVRRGWLGVDGETIPAAQAEDLGVAGGAAVTLVAPGSPAAMAGVAPGDVITEIDGTAIGTMGGLVLRLRAHRPGDAIGLAVVRNGQRQIVEVTLAEKPVP